MDVPGFWGCLKFFNSLASQIYQRPPQNLQIASNFFFLFSQLSKSEKVINIVSLISCFGAKTSVRLLDICLVDLAFQHKAE